MSTMDPIGQQLPEETRVTNRITNAVDALDQHRPRIHRWFWKGLVAFNLVMGSVVFWTVVVPSLL